MREIAGISKFDDAEVETRMHAMVEEGWLDALGEDRRGRPRELCKATVIPEPVNPATILEAETKRRAAEEKELHDREEQARVAAR